MFEGINEVAILVSAILAVAVGSIWYSPLLFGTSWMRALKMSEADIEAVKPMMPKLFAVAAFVNLALMLMLATLVNVAGASGYTIYNVAGAVTAVSGLFMTGGALWEMRPLSYVLINLGYITIVVFGGMTVISLWPW